MILDMMQTGAGVWVLARQFDAPFELPVGSDYMFAVIIVGFLMSPITSALNRRDWSPELKAFGAFLWCALAAVLLLIAGDRLDWGVIADARALFSTFLVVFVMAIGLYQFYFRPSGVAKSIERATG